MITGYKEGTALKIFCHFVGNFSNCFRQEYYISSKVTKWFYVPLVFEANAPTEKFIKTIFVYQENLPSV